MFVFVFIFYIFFISVFRRFPNFIALKLKPIIQILVRIFRRLLILKIKHQQLFRGFFDKVVLFGKSEIVVADDIFETRSTFNIKTNKWTIYKGQFIKIYNCTKKRRF